MVIIEDEQKLHFSNNLLKVINEKKMSKGVGWLVFYNSGAGEEATPLNSVQGSLNHKGGNKGLLSNLQFFFSLKS